MLTHFQLLRLRLRSGSSVLVLVAAGFCLSSCQRAGVLDPQGPVGYAERLILINATGIMLVVVLPVILMALGFAWWFRASNTKATYVPTLSYSGQVELVVWSIPTMIVILLAGVGWISSHELDPRKPLKADAKPIQVQVVSLDWKWLFIYPEQNVATLNQLYIPAGTPVEFSLTSATVMNAFFVPQLGSQIYTMPGMTTHLNLMADKPGDFPGLSSHFSGDHFSDMRFITHSLPAAEFAEWVNRTKGENKPLDENAYNVLLRPGIETPQTYSAVDPKMFERILDLAAPQGMSHGKGH